MMKSSLILVSVAALALSPLSVAASNSSLPMRLAQATTPVPTSPTAPPATIPLFSQEELRKLLSPIALFPDPLLAQLLPASAYPLEIVQLARWLDKNQDAVAKQDFSGVDAQNWDPTVKALARFPSIVKKMNDDLDWTSGLGEAFVEQPQDVAATIQDLRLVAQKNGVLKTTPQQTVTTNVENNRQVIIVEPAVPDQIYVPVYTDEVYSSGVGTAVAAGLLTFGTAIAIGAIANNASWNWGSGVVYPPVWGGAYRPGRPIVTGDVNIGNSINAGNIVGNTKPWRPDPQRLNSVQNRRPDGVRRDGANITSRTGNLQGGDLQRPNLQRPAGSVQRPQALPAAPAVQRPNPTAFSGIDRGQASAAFANRGAASRAQIARPQGGARPAIQAGGGGPRGGAARGGGGRRR
jgi:hypothetical protein